MTAGGDHNISVFFPKHSFVFFFYNGRTNGSLFHIIETKFFQRSSHGFNPDTFIISNKRRCKTYHHRFLSLKQYLYFFSFIHNLFCILRADYKTLSAQNTFVTDDMCLISGKTNRFYRAMTNALVTVFTIGFFQRQTIRHFPFPL